MKEFSKPDILKFKSKILERTEQELEFPPDERRLLRYLMGETADDLGSGDATRELMERSDVLKLSLQERLDRARRLIALFEDKRRMSRILQVVRQWMA